MGKPRGQIRNPTRLRQPLLAWYDARRRELPWRGTQDPFAIWVSEIMLQQTRVAAVIDRFKAFMAHFPTVGALARAQEQEVPGALERTGLLPPGANAPPGRAPGNGKPRRRAAFNRG